MRSSIPRAALLLALLTLLGVAAPARAAEVTVLHRHRAMLSEPRGVVSDGAGFLVGCTSTGGSANAGVVFKVPTAGGPLIVLHEFSGSDGANPFEIALGADGRIYGTAYSGGAYGEGVIFALQPDGTRFAVLHSFRGSDGAQPTHLVLGPDGRIYGTTLAGGARGRGALFALGADGSSFAVLRDFNGTSMSECPFELILEGDVLYGTARGDGLGGGRIFAVKTDGTGFTTLHAFGFQSEDGVPHGLSSDGAGTLYGCFRNHPSEAGGGASLFRIGTDGSGFAVLRALSPAEGSDAFFGPTLTGAHLIGLTTWGGPQGGGTLYRLRTDGTGFEVLFAFHAGFRPGYAPLTLVGDRLYGAAMIDGVPGVFTAAADGSGLTALTTAAGYPSDGSSPNGLIADGRGWLYGTAAQGGPFNRGTVFRLREDGGEFEVLHGFTLADGAKPFTLVLDDAGTLYGATAATTSTGDDVAPTIFALNTDGSSFRTLAVFDPTTPVRDIVVGYTRTIFAIVGDRLLRVRAGGAISDRGPLPSGSTSLTLGPDDRLYGTTSQMVYSVRIEGGDERTVAHVEGSLAPGLLFADGKRLFGVRYNASQTDIFTVMSDGYSFAVVRSVPGAVATKLLRAEPLGAMTALLGARLITFGPFMDDLVRHDFGSTRDTIGSPAALLLSGNEAFGTGTMESGVEFRLRLDPRRVRRRLDVSRPGGSALAMPLDRPTRMP